MTRTSRPPTVRGAGPGEAVRRRTALRRAVRRVLPSATVMLMGLGGCAQTPVPPQSPSHGSATAAPLVVDQDRPECGDVGEPGRRRRLPWSMCQEPCCRGECPDGNCNQVCVSEDCGVTCAGGDCRIKCFTGLCVSTCDEGGCSQTCDSMATCRFSCMGGGCSQSCEDYARCELRCEGGGCEQRVVRHPRLLTLERAQREGHCWLGCSGGSCEQVCLVSGGLLDCRETCRAVGDGEPRYHPRPTPPPATEPPP